MLHAVGLVAALIVGAALVSSTSGRRELAAAVFAGSVATMLALSSLYHRIIWSPRARLWMRRADHAGIYILIAGTTTAVGLVGRTAVCRRSSSGSSGPVPPPPQ